MRKKIVSCALAITLAATLFTGCGSSKKDENVGEYITLDGLKASFKTNQEINTTDSITLTVWESVSGPDEFIKQAGDWFTQLYPNIKIKYVNVESTDSGSKIANDGPAGNGPDLFAAAHDKMGTMQAQSTILEVPESDIDIVSQSCSATALAGATLRKADGTQTLYGYPVSVETYALFYNKALISEDQIPKTMEELVSYITEYKSSHNDGTEPFLIDAGNAYYSVFFTSNATTHLYGDSGNDVTNTYMNSEQSVKQMDDFVKLAQAIDLNTGDIDYKHNDSMFSGGMLAMNVSGAWNIKTYEEDGVDFGITSIPSLTGTSEPPANFMGVRCMFVSNYSEHQPEAIAFAEFLMTKEMQKLRCEITSTMPAREDVLAEIEDPKVKAYMDGLQKQMAYSYPMPNMGQGGLFWTPFNTAYANIWNGEVSDIQAELDKANKAATKN